MNRREFLKTAFFTSIATVVLGACKKVAIETKSLINKVTKRKYLKGLKKEEVSLLGFGCMRFPTIDGIETNIDQAKVDKMIDYAMEHGVNYYDTAYFYHNGKSEFAIGKALKKYPRDSFFFVDKMPLSLIQKQEDVENYFNEQLKKCQTDYFDFYLAHNITKNEYETLKKFKIYEQLAQKKKEGKIKYLGFSFHDTPELLEEVIKEYKWDFVQLQINAIDWEMSEANKQYQIAVDNNLQVTVMNPLKGGQIATLSDKAVEILRIANSEVSPASWGLRYVASLPNVLSVLSGMTTLDQVVDNVKTFTDFKILSKQEQEVFAQAITEYKTAGAISCTGCKYCINCPVEIDIPKIFLIYNQYKVAKQWKEWGFMTAYNLIPEEKRADKCINCGICKTKCPQKLDIPNLLKEVDNLYKSLTK